MNQILTNKKQYAAFLGVFFLVGMTHIFAQDSETPASESSQNAFEQYRVLIDLIDSVAQNYVHPYSREELIEAAIDGVTNKLDPYSYYLGGEDLNRFQRETNSQFGGVGMAIDSRDGKIVVVAPLVGMPAYNAGIFAGDEILEIDGTSVKGEKIDDVLQRLTREIGTSVQLKVRRPGTSKPLDFQVERELVLLETVLGFDRNPDDSWNFWLDKPNGIAYIRVTEFKDETANEIRKALEQLQKPENPTETQTEKPSENQTENQTKNPLRGLILDLRFNPGGAFNVAIEMGNMFIPEGVIVSAKGKNTVEQVWRATPEMVIPKDVPLVILLNSYSASASEVFSACLQDNQRAIIVGDRSFGKGIIQSMLDFEGGVSRLKLTTAGYYSPNGRNIHRNEGAVEADEWGVKPLDEHLVQMTAEEEQMLMNDMLLRGTLKTHNNIPARRNPVSFQDKQLEKALDVVEKALKTGTKGSRVLMKRASEYRTVSGDAESGSGRRSYWRR